jgi:glycerol-3-phosphate dehydrogenase
MDAEVAVVGAGVVGSAVALGLARRGVSTALIESEPAPAFGASGTNSGILHTGFDSKPGELETELILGSAKLRDPVIDALEVPALRCGALLRPLEEGQTEAVRELADNARRNGVDAELREDGALEVPGEAVTDPVAYTLALATAAGLHGAEIHAPWHVAAIEDRGDALVLSEPRGESLRVRLAVNCAGLCADEVAGFVGDESFEIYPRKGEFLVFDPPGGEPLDRILLPVPSERTKGMLVFPSVDGKVIAGPTAVDQEDKRDWSVRPAARGEILSNATRMCPPLEGSEPIDAYAGLRPAGRDANYVIGPSAACPKLVNAAAIRSTGLSASLGIAERICAIAGELGVGLGPEQPLRSGEPEALEGPWWRRTAEHVAQGHPDAKPRMPR